MSAEARGGQTKLIGTVTKKNAQQEFASQSHIQRQGRLFGPLFRHADSKASQRPETETEHCTSGQGYKHQLERWAVAHASRFFNFLSSCCRGHYSKPACVVLVKQQAFSRTRA